MNTMYWCTHCIDEYNVWIQYMNKMHMNTIYECVDISIVWAQCMSTMYE